MNKKYFLINVTGHHGYSFMVLCGAKDEDEAIELAAEENLFEDEEDVEYATCEEASEYDIIHFKKFDMIHEI